MKDIIDTIRPWVSAKEPFALATVLKTWGSAPRKMGANMAVSQSGKIAGSVSGGCVEGDVSLKSMEVLKTGLPQKVHYGVTDDDAWSVGLSCGGQIDVFIEPFFIPETQEQDQVIWQKIIDAIDHNHGLVFARKLSEIEIERSTWDLQVIAEKINDPIAIASGQAIHERAHKMAGEGKDAYFLQVIPARSRLIIVGASHLAAELVKISSLYDFETIVIDPRSFFLENTKFHAAPSQIHDAWPDEILPQFDLNSYSYCVTLTHDPKIDDQALHHFLKSETAYIGCLGSRKTHAKRIERLTQAGFTQQQIERIHGPVGLNVNPQSASEIALSILAQIIQVKNAFI